MPSTGFQVPGPCSVQFNNVDIGVTKSGVIIRGRTNWRPITDDAHGEEPADFILAGKSATVEIVGLETGDAPSVRDIWKTYQGLLGSQDVADVGDLAGTVGFELDIIEANDTDHWIANKAVPLDPDTLLLQSTVELNVPLVFLITPDANDKLFVTIPSYIQTA